jgi:putative addiction module component (TIGR02574 family)
MHTDPLPRSSCLSTEEQKEELLRRLADDIANPDEVEPWESVKAAALALTGQ